MIKLQKCALPLAALSSLAAAPAACLADDYRAEVRGVYSQLEGPADFPDLDAFSVQGRWYFEPVKTDGLPLAEAAFLGRASSVSVGAARSDTSFATQRVFHLNSQGASIGYYIPDTMFFAGVSASRGERITGISSTVVQKDYDTAWSGVVGVAPLDGLLVTTEFHEHGYDPNLTARYVGKLPNAHYYAGTVRLVDPDGADATFGVDFDYYFDDTFSAGLGYADGAESVTGRVRKFFSPRFSLGGSYTTNDFSDSFSVDVAWRF
jgi:hypothetical protein